MSTNYPAALDTTTQLKNDANDATVTAAIHAGAHNNVADAIIAVETVLGINPKGTYASVAAFLNALDTGSVKLAPTAAQIVVPTNDVVAVAVKLGNALNVANMFEARLADNTIVSFIDRLGNFSAQSLRINGTLLNSTHLSDSASLARLASPTFTGTPTAPTPASTDSSTKVATTAFVQAAGGLPIGGVIDWPYAAAGIPSWSALTYGQAISRATYPTLDALASAAGYPHGNGDTTTTFNVPDYRGRVGVGKDDMGGAAANRITIAIAGFNGTTLGAVGGGESVTLTTAQLPAHNHPHSLTLPDHTHAQNPNTIYGSGGGAASTQGGVWGTLNAIVTGGVSSFPAINGSIGNTGNGSPVPNVQPSIVVNKIIRIQ